MIMKMSTYFTGPNKDDFWILQSPVLMILYIDYILMWICLMTEKVKCFQINSHWLATQIERPNAMTALQIFVSNKLFFGFPINLEIAPYLKRDIYKIIGGVLKHNVVISSGGNSFITWCFVGNLSTRLLFFVAKALLTLVYKYYMAIT